MIDDHSINFAATNGDTLDQKGLAPCHACTGNPCGDHGECIASADGTFTCNCDDKYSGKFCDTNGKLFYYLLALPNCLHDKIRTSNIN